MHKCDFLIINLPQCLSCRRSLSCACGRDLRHSVLLLERQGRQFPTVHVLWLMLVAEKEVGEVDINLLMTPKQLPLPGHSLHSRR